MVGLDDPHFSWFPLAAWGVSANIQKLSLSHIWSALCEVGQQILEWHTIHSSAILLSQVVEAQIGQTMMGQLFCGLCALCGLFLLNIPSYIIVSRCSIVNLVLNLNSWSPWSPDQLCCDLQEQVVEKWDRDKVGEKLSSHYHCHNHNHYRHNHHRLNDRKRVAKQGRRKKKADILFNLAMSGGMSGVSTTTKQT